MKLENLDKMYCFLESQKEVNISQDLISLLNCPITSKEIGTVFNNLYTKKSPGTDGFSTEFYQTFKEYLTPILFKIFHKIEAEGTLPNSFYEAKITLIPKPHKDPTRKENFQAITLMKTDAKLPNKILTNQVQEHIKLTIHHDKLSFILGMEVGGHIWKPINVIHYINKF